MKFTIGLICLLIVSSGYGQTTTAAFLKVKKVNGMKAYKIKQEPCLPQPSKAFMEAKWNMEIYRLFPATNEGFYVDDIYAYLAMSTDSTGEKSVLKRSEGNEVLEWQQTFASGITYKNIQYPEVGGGGILYTKCKNKQTFAKIIHQVVEYVPCEDCYDVGNSWDTDSTSYGPVDDGAGCYYNIQTDSLGYLMLDWYCGC